MTTKVSSKGQIVLPVRLRRKMALSAGETLAINFETAGGTDRIVITRNRPQRPKMKITIDPTTKLPVAKGPPGSPKITSAMVRELLADFP